MDPYLLDQKPGAPRKVKFQPKSQVRRPPKPAVAKKEAVDDTEAAEQKELLRRLQEGLASGKPKVHDKKSEPERVAFGYGSSIPQNQYNTFSARYQGKAHFSTLRDEEYIEPWNYYSYYPTTVPLRRPYSGNPEILDEEEFGELSSFDERMTNPAWELGLMEDNSEPRLLFFQLPRTIPATKRAAATAGNAQSTSSKPPTGGNPVEKPCGFHDLQAGIMGKMMVYKSGAVKLKLGDTLYDVTPGSDCVFAQDVIAVNAEQKHCCTVGELKRRTILTPDVDSILDSFADFGIS